MSNENGNITPEINENQIFAQRVAKLDDIAAAGVYPFGCRFDRTPARM